MASGRRSQQKLKMAEEKQLQSDESPKKKKLRIDDAKEHEKNARTNDGANLSKMEESKVVLETSSELSRPNCRLPLELECEAFKCLPLPIQRKFICGLGKGIYGYFGPRIRAKLQAKRIANPPGNCWAATETSRHVRYSPDRLRIRIQTDRRRISHRRENIFAERGFIISPKYYRKDRFAGIIANYFEVTQTSTDSTRILEFYIGLSDKHLDNYQYNFHVGKAANSYGASNIQNFTFFSYHCAGVEQRVAVSDMLASAAEASANTNTYYNKGGGDVFGCGILLDQKNRMSIFFTRNGILLGKQIPLKASGSRLYPTVSASSGLFDDMTLEANFGDNLDLKPFIYDINKCPGLLFE